jgi:hypothetical protein
VALCAAAVLLAAPAWATPQKNSSENVKITATPEKSSDSARVVKLRLKIADGWYAYANPVGNEDLAPNATTVKVKGVKDADVKVTFPKAKVKEDKTIGNYNYYTGDVDIVAAVKNATGTLEFEVTVNTCHLIRGVCLPPGTVTVKVP